MKTYNIYTLLLCLFIVATTTQCSKEDEPEASNLDINWYELQDSSDPLDHLRYTIFQSSGVPIYYNDTIGQQNRGKDAFGKDIIYHEIIDCSYSITSSTPITWITIPKVRDDVYEAVELIRDNVLPNVPVSIRPRSFLVVDSLVRKGDASSYNYQAYTYKAMMTTVVGELYKWNSIDKKELAAKIIAEEVGTYLINKSGLDLTNFFIISRYNDNSLYNLDIPNTSSAIPYASWESYGFLTYHKGASFTAGKKYKAISQYTDVHDYLTECYYNKLTGRSDAEFETEYAAYPLIIQKYRLINEILDELLLTLKQENL